MPAANGNARVAVQHVWFERELITASGVTTLEEAAPQWEFSHYDMAHNGSERCQVCPTTGLVWVVVIHNKVNGMYLRIGHDCYDKLLLYLKIKRIVAVSLSSRTEYATKIRCYITDQLGDMPGRKVGIISAMTKWFEAQDDLPEGIALTLACVKRVRHPLNIKDAEAFVDYYKTHRLFGLLEFLTDAERNLVHHFPYPRRLPKYITIAALPKLRHVLQEGKRIWDLRMDRVRDAAHKKWQEERKELARGVNLERTDMLYEVTSVRLRFCADGSNDRLYECVVRGWKDPFPTFVVDDLKMSMPKHATFHAPEEKPWQASHVPIRVTMREEDVRAWEERAMSAKRIRVADAECGALAWMELMLEEKPHLYVKGTFRQVPHPRGGGMEWQMRIGGEKFILQNGESYEEKDGAVYLHITKELARNRVYLVARVHMDRSHMPFRWYYNTYYTGNVTEYVTRGRGRHVVSVPRTRFVHNKPVRHLCITNPYGIYA